MNVLLIGSGGREHALALALSKSPSLKKLYCTPGNPGILSIAKKADVSTSIYRELKEFCINKNIDLLVVGPEQPLADGIADFFLGSNTAVFGPSKQAAQLESSKDFAKKIMYKYGVPTAGYKTFTAAQTPQAIDFVNFHPLPVVLKADGLAAGKGVVVAEDLKDALEAIEKIFGGNYGNHAGKKVVIEEFMRGEEASVFAICDGTDYITLSTAQDHKRIGEGDTGRNTGGMGAYSPAPVVNDIVLEKTKKEIIEPILAGMKQEGNPFVGCLYCGIMIENNQPKVVEFNVRFGDPETQVILPLFEGDFAKLLLSAANRKIDKTAYSGNKNGAAACVILASEGYPRFCKKGYEITGIAEAEDENTTVYHSGTKEKDLKLISAGGRVVGITNVAEDLKSATANVYEAVEKVKFENKYFRSDIAYKALKKK